MQRSLQSPVPNVDTRARVEQKTYSINTYEVPSSHVQRRHNPLAFVIDVRSFGDEVAEYQVAWSMD